jgi:hypothetical protein
MGRTGYAIVLLLIAALAGVVFWPEPRTDDRVAVIPAGERPASFRLHTPAFDQEVAGDTVRIAGVERPLDPDKADHLWNYLGQLGLAKRLVVEGVAEAQLSAYGLDGGRELAAATVRLRWGAVDGRAYLWEGVSRRVFAASPAVVTSIDELTRRLDRDQLVNPARLSRLEASVGAQRTALVSDGRDWHDELLTRRPPFARRVERLKGLLAALRLDDLAAKPPAGEPDLATVRLERDRALPGLGQVVRLWNAGEAALVQVDALPPQRLAPAQAREWREALADLSRDFIVDLASTFAASPLTEVLVARGGTELFRLEKHGLRDREQGLSQWDVVWPGGRETADGEAAASLASAFDHLAVGDAQPRGPEPLPAEATTIDFVFQIDQRHERLAFAPAAGGFQVWGPAYRGTAAALPPELAGLGPERMLDLGLIGRGAERVTKLQRVFRDEAGAPRAEVFALDAAGSWRQTHPAEARARPVDQLAVERLARVVCVARARSARFLTAADRALLAAPAFELDLRFAPVTVRHSNDNARLDDTTDQDVGLACAREGDAWRVVDKEGAVSFLVDAEVVDLLRLPLSDNLVLPLLPGQVRRIEVLTPEGGYVLAADAAGAAWTAQAVDAAGKPGAKQAADPTEVRRYLRRLATLRAARTDPKAAPLQASEAQATVACVLPSGDATERMVLSIGRHAAPGDDWVLSAESDAAGRHGPVGRCFLPAAEAATVAALTPPLASLLAADAAAGR